MPDYSDIYVISSLRDPQTVNKFLNHFLPKRRESADEYEVPQYSETPSIIYKKANDLIEYCACNKSEEHSIYWMAMGGGKPEHGMVFYLQDSNVIYGLSTDASDQDYAKQLLNEMKVFFDSDFGYIGHEAAPDASSLMEFKEQINAHKP